MHADAKLPHAPSPPSAVPLSFCCLAVATQAVNNEDQLQINPGSATGAYSAFSQSVQPSFVLMDLDGSKVSEASRGAGKGTGPASLWPLQVVWGCAHCGAVHGLCTQHLLVPTNWPRCGEHLHAAAAETECAGRRHLLAQNSHPALLPHPLPSAC